MCPCSAFPGLYMLQQQCFLLLFCVALNPTSRLHLLCLCVDLKSKNTSQFKPHTLHAKSDHRQGRYLILFVSPCALSAASDYLKPHRLCNRSSEFAAAKEAFDRSFQRQEDIMAKINSKSLIQALGRKAEEADEEAEELYRKFLAGDITVEAFVPAYTQKKKLFHQRELKTQAAQQIF